MLNCKKFSYFAYGANRELEKHTESAQGVSTELLFMHTDVQGSTVLITANVSFGDVLRQQLNYDPWGKQALIYTSSQFITGHSLGDSHGYTGHTMVNDFDLVHMGGRTYNPVLGRFMQADPFIQAGANLQNYNRYSYVLNNPMSYTDPSGYLFKALKDNWRVLASIAVTVLVPGIGFIGELGLSAGGMGALTGFISGAVATGSLRGAVIGALTGSMFGGLSELGDTLQGVIGHGLVGGMSSMVQGGEFQAGFLSAGLVKAASVAGIMPAVGDNTPRERVANAIVAGTIGGTVSVAAGGKFANGALTAVYSRLLNGMAESQKPDSSGVDSSLTLEERIAAFEQSIDQLYTDKVLSNNYHLTHEAAANEVLEAITPLSEYYNLEAGGNITQSRLTSGRIVYSYSRPVVGGEGSVSVSGGAIGYHTHPSGPLLFSNEYQRSRGLPSDTEWVKQNRQHLYLGVMIEGKVQIAICEYQSACMNGIHRDGATGRRVR